MAKTTTKYCLLSQRGMSNSSPWDIPSCIFYLCPSSTQLNQMVELPFQLVIKFGRGLLMSHLLDSGVWKRYIGKLTAALKDWSWISLV